jgi:hypothetical protein
MLVVALTGRVFTDGEGKGGPDMTGGSDDEGVPHARHDDELDPLLRDPRVMDWFGENLTQLRRSASGQRLLYWSVGVGLVIGLAAHVGGYLLRSSTETEPLVLIADLLYGLGLALWTGIVVVVFVQIFPEAKRRQINKSLDAYEAALRDKARAGGDQGSGTVENNRSE